MYKKALSFVIVMALVISSSWMLLASPAQQAVAAPISCDGRAYMVRATPTGLGSTYSELYEFRQSGTSIDLSVMHNAPTGLTYNGSAVNDTTAFPSGFLLNALAYNPVDGYMYAAVNRTPATPNELVRIHDDGHLETVGSVNVTAGNLKGAAFNSSGVYYALTTPGTLYSVSGLDTATTASPAGPATTLTLSPTVPMGDLVYNQRTNALYAISNDTIQVSTINTSTGVTTPISASVPLGPGVTIDDTFTNGIGSAFFTSTGELRAYINQASASTGQLVKIDMTTNRVTLIMEGPVTNDSDGTACNRPIYSIDTVKSAGTVTTHSPTSFTVPYTVKVANLGTIADPNVQLVDNLTLTFAAGSPTITVSNLTTASGPCTVNSSYNGTTILPMLTGTDTLNPNASCTLTFDVGLQYAQASDVPTAPQRNTVLASSVAGSVANPGHTYNGNEPTEPFNQLAVDISNDSAALPSSANGDPSTPTPVTLTPPTYVLDIVKIARSVKTITSTKYSVEYGLTMGNTGLITVPNVQMNDHLRSTFKSGAPSITVDSLARDEGTCTVNNGFNGDSDTKLLSGTDSLASGEHCTITVAISLHYAAATDVPTTAQDNIAFASGTAAGPNPGYTYTNDTPTPPANALTTDQSTDGLAVPATPHGDTPSPTPVTFGQLANTGANVSLILTVTFATVGMSALLFGARYRSLLRRR